MMIATMIFIVGFVSVYGMFLAGSKFRRQSDSLTQTALAATSLIETLRLRAGTEAGGPYAPADYVGDGDPTNNDSGPEEGFVPFPDQPSIWYRFDHAADLNNVADSIEPGALGFRIVLQLIDLGSTPTDGGGNHQLSVSEIGDRLRITRDLDRVYRPSLSLDERDDFDDLPDDEARIVYVLRLRGLLIEQEAFINRRGL